MPIPRRLLAAACMVAAAAGFAPSASASGHRLPMKHHTRPIYTVPASITSDCSKPVDKKINSWLRKAPKDADVEFVHGACYGQNHSITLSGRKDLVVDGNGAKFRTLTSGTSMQAAWQFVDDTNVTVEHIHVVGTDHHAQTSKATYDASKAFQHGFSVQGSKHLTIAHVSAVNVWGDGVHVSYDRRNQRSVPAHDIAVRHARIDGTGRHGVSMGDVDGFTLADSSISHNDWEGVDVEPAVNSEIARHIHIKDNTFGPDRLGMFANYGNGLGNHVGHMKIVGNVQTAKPVSCRASISISTPPGARRAHYVVKDNQLVGFATAIRAHEVDYLDVEHNTVVGIGPPRECGVGAGVSINHSAHDVVTHNHFSGSGIGAVLDDHIDCRLVHTAHNQVGN